VPRDSRNDWTRFDPSSIPTKTELGPLEEWFSRTPGAGKKVLDLGCGVGEVSLRLAKRGFSVVGVDINEEALERARKLSPHGVFHKRDVAAAEGLHLEEAPFDVVVCQLVISIVGGPDERRSLVRNAWEALSPGGRLYLSASGVSDDINPGYARLYEEDYPVTGERHTYCSRDASGRVLYETHHFTAEELRSLLETAGFEELEIEEKIETSSRRTNEPARFLYAFCRKSSRP
jgi:SAM-dependent methyltransferase